MDCVQRLTVLREGDDLFGAGVKIIFFFIINGTRLKGLVALLVMMMTAVTAASVSRRSISLHPVEIEKMIQRRNTRRQTARHIRGSLHSQFAENLVLDDFQIASAQFFTLDARRAIGRDVSARLWQQTHQRCRRWAGRRWAIGTGVVDETVVRRWQVVGIVFVLVIQSVSGRLRIICRRGWGDLLLLLLVSIGDVMMMSMRMLIVVFVVVEILVQIIGRISSCWLVVMKLSAGNVFRPEDAHQQKGRGEEQETTGEHVVLSSDWRIFSHFDHFFFVFLFFLEGAKEKETDKF